MFYVLKGFIKIKGEYNNIINDIYEYMRKNKYNLINRMDNVMETIILCPNVRIDSIEVYLQEIENVLNEFLRFDCKN